MSRVYPGPRGEKAGREEGGPTCAGPTRAGPRPAPSRRCEGRWRSDTAQTRRGRGRRGAGRTRWAPTPPTAQPLLRTPDATLRGPTHPPRVPARRTAVGSGATGADGRGGRGCTEGGGREGAGARRAQRAAGMCGRCAARRRATQRAAARHPAPQLRTRRELPTHVGCFGLGSRTWGRTRPAQNGTPFFQGGPSLGKLGECRGAQDGRRLLEIQANFHPRLFTASVSI